MAIRTLSNVAQKKTRVLFVNYACLAPWIPSKSMHCDRR